MKTNEQVPAKKPYEKPTLRVYGNVRAMTETGTMGKNMDSFTGPRKTA